MSPRQYFSAQAIFLLAITLALLGWYTSHCEQIVQVCSIARSKNCQSGRIYFPQTKKCYISGTQGPCPGNLVIGQSVRSNTLGECRCRTPYGNSDNAGTRPVLFVAKSSRCYPIFHQGPCPNGEWVVAVAGRQNEGVCEKIPCPEKYYVQFIPRLAKLPERDEVFVYPFDGKCYTTGDRCGTGDSSGQLYFTGRRGLSPECTPTRSVPDSRLCSGAGGYSQSQSVDFTVLQAPGPETFGISASNMCADGLPPAADSGCEPLPMFI